MERYDLVVIGGGPAGSTLATLAKKHQPGRRILLVEKTPFPRHHIGESLLPGIIPVLKDMGVYEKVEAAGFPKKLGATYVWGADREPWEADFGEIEIGEMLRKHGRILEDVEFAWQVRRGEYDKILLDHAKTQGVEVLEGWSASGIREDSRGRITGVTLLSPGGEACEYSCDTLADCSGQNGFLSRFRDIRRYNPDLQNVAGYAYFRGAPWKYAYTGHPDKTRIFVCSTDNGWFWYIPVAADTVSIGFVTPLSHLKASGLDMRALYEKALAGCVELRPQVEAAERVPDVEGTGKDFFTLSDWSYLSESAAGEGWIAAGDAAVFVDPILSSGVTLAHLSAQRAAYTLGTLWVEKDPGMRADVLRDYNEFYREAAAGFLALALYWYGNDRRAAGWWSQARAATAPLVPFDLSDKRAFVLVASGLTQYYERQFAVGDAAFPSGGSSSDFPFFSRVLGHGTAPELAAVPDHGDRPALAYPLRIVPAFLPDPAAGHLKCAHRAVFERYDPAGPHAALNPRRYVLERERFLLEAIDGTATVLELEERLAARFRLGADAAHAAVHALIADLQASGLAATAPGVAA